MAEETITILKVGTEEAVKSVNDLKNNIKILKDNLGELEIGTEEYQNTLDELKVNQNALKDAMYATSASMEDLAKAATGTSETYNSLVHRMAALKEELRNTDISTDRGKQRFQELAGQINEVNDKLKEMDALQGNYQRNVGNYESAFKGFSKYADTFKKGLDATKGGVMGVKSGFDALSASPVVGTISILISLFMKLSDSLKEDEEGTNAVKKGMDALKPVMDFFSGLLGSIVDILADLITKVASFVSSNGLFQKVIQGVVGVGNSVLKFVVAPFKGVIAAIKVFKEQGVKGLGDAAKAFGQEMKSGVAFKENFQAGQAVADTIIAGAKSKKKDAKDAGKNLGKDLKDGLLDGLDKLQEELDKQLEADIAAIMKAYEEENKAAVKKAEDRLNALDKAVNHQKELNSILVEDDEERASKEYEIEQAANQKKLDLLDQFKKEALDRGDLDAYLAFDQERADLSVEIETNALREKMRLRKQDLKDAEEKSKAQKALLKGVASATSGILGSIADMYEEDEENSEKNADKIKGLRIAAATIDTLSGAIGAFMQASETIPPPYGQIVGAVSAAAVTAAGIAEIAKIKSTKVNGSSGSAATPTSPAVASAPTLTTEVANVRSLTSASEEDRLNQMASDQRVYIVASDIEASQNQIKTQVAESSF